MSLILFCKNASVGRKKRLYTDINVEIWVVLGRFSVQTIFSSRSDWILAS